MNRAGGLGDGPAVAHKVAQPGERRGLLEAHGWRVSRLTLGTLQFGGQRGRQDDQSSIRTVHAALDAGINVIDTADSYGSGHSEEVIGRALGKRRPDVILATKFDLKPDVPPTREVLRAALMHSLRRLQTGYIDLYQVHNIPLAAMQSPEIFDRLESLRDEGLVRAIGAPSAASPRHPRRRSTGPAPAAPEQTPPRCGRRNRGTRPARGSGREGCTQPG